MSKRFYLFVQRQPSERDSVPLRILQECMPLQAHVQVVYVSAENAQSLPPAVKSNGLPSLFDATTGSCSKDAGAVIQAMARRAQATMAAAPRGAIGVAQVPIPQRAEPKASMDVVTRRGNLEVGEGFSKAEAGTASSLIESRSAAGGFGTAGSSFMGMGNAMRVTSRLNEEDGGWQSASLGMTDTQASRLLAESFGAIGGATVVPPTATTNPQSYRAPRAGERSEKVDMDSEEFKSLLDSRMAADKAYKSHQQAASPAPHTMGQQAMSRQERLQGAEGLQLLRPLVKPAPGASDALKHIPF